MCLGAVGVGPMSAVPPFHFCAEGQKSTQQLAKRGLLRPSTVKKECK